MPDNILARYLVLAKDVITPALSQQRRYVDTGLYFSDLDQHRLADRRLDELREMRTEALREGYRLGVDPVKMGEILDKIVELIYALVFQHSEDKRVPLLPRIHKALQPIRDILLCAEDASIYEGRDETTWSEPGTIKGWAKRFGLTRNTMRQWLVLQRVPSRQIGTLWQIDLRFIPPSKSQQKKG
jgi:hypothetical protein